MGARILFVLSLSLTACGEIREVVVDAESGAASTDTSTGPAQSEGPGSTTDFDDAGLSSEVTGGDSGGETSPAPELVSSCAPAMLLAQGDNASELTIDQDVVPADLEVLVRFAQMTPGTITLALARGEETRTLLTLDTAACSGMLYLRFAEQAEATADEVCALSNSGALDPTVALAPAESLASFMGTSAEGAWTLQVTAADGLVATIDSWCLSVHLGG